MGIVREATTEDGPALGKMGAALARLHHAFDAQRFMLPEGVEAGYRKWLLHEAANSEAVVLVAEEAGEVMGYAYGAVAERDWNALRDRCAAFHDLWVEDKARGRGLGRALTEEMLGRLASLGLPRVVLSTSTSNEAAQRLFKGLGFRPTMIEMTRELLKP